LRLLFFESGWTKWGLNKEKDGMIKHYSLILAASIGLGLAVVPDVATAQTTYIQCPADAQISVTTGVAGWEAIYTSQRIARTEVVSGGGNRQVLRCIYERGVVVQQTAPAGATCEELDSTGFACNTLGGNGSAQRPVTTQHTGRVTLSPGEQIDLDGTNGSPWNNDIWLTGANERDLALAPFADASISAPQARQLSYNDCSQFIYGTQSTPLRQLRAGDYFCARTNEGRVAAVRIDDVRTQGTSIGVTIGFASYNQ
jgi:hypothetical protein